MLPKNGWQNFRPHPTVHNGNNCPHQDARKAKAVSQWNVIAQNTTPTLTHCIVALIYCVMKRFPTFLTFATLALVGRWAHAETSEIVWKTSDPGCRAEDMVVDAQGTSTLACTVFSDDFHSVLRTLSYDAQGKERWRAEVPNAFGLNHAQAITNDDQGNIYVTGAAQVEDHETDILTLAYSSSGKLLWKHTYDGYGSSDWGHDILADHEGNVYVLGNSNNNGNNAVITTIKLDPTGHELWSSKFEGPEDASASGFGQSIIQDSQGFLYVAGMQQVLKLDPTTGDPEFLLAERTISIALDEQENLILTSPGGTKKFTSAGDLLWNSTVGGFNLAVRPTGIWLTQPLISSDGNQWDYQTSRLNHHGKHQWTTYYKGTRRDSPVGIVVDNQDNAYVTGRSEAKAGLFGVRNDYLTIKYGPSGNEIWQDRYTNGDYAQAISLGPQGDVWVTGWSGTTIRYTNQSTPPAPSCPWWAFWCYWG
jgi:hypothetical protein